MDVEGHPVLIRWAHGGALVGLAFSVALAAVAAIPPTLEAVPPAEGQPVIEPLALRPAEGVLPAPGAYVRQDRFQSGDTLARLLDRLDVEESDARRLLRVNELRRLRPGTTVTVEMDADGALHAVSFLGARETLVRMERAASEFRVAERSAPFETQSAMKSGIIRSSLFAAADSAGVPDPVAMQLADIFGGDIDFHRDLRSGDRFTVVYEVLMLEGRPVRSGRVLAAEFANQGKAYRAVWYSGGYYTPEGKNMRKAFLRSPLEFSRVSSAFGLRRHPFLHSWRAHQGVDYAAPTGTRVRATGDGVVEFVGQRSGYGNTVVLRHQGAFSTVYAHLNGFSRGLRRGARLAQGEALGFVGQTGWATGPHLHYEFRISGQARNPLAVAMPAAHPVAPQEMRAFREHAGPLVARLDLLADRQLALLE